MRILTFCALSLFTATGMTSAVQAGDHGSRYEPYTYGYYGDPASSAGLFGLGGKPSSATAYPAEFGPVYVDGTSPVPSIGVPWTLPPEYSRRLLGRHFRNKAANAPTGYPIPTATYSINSIVIP
jgi:hypothetical protein